MANQFDIDIHENIFEYIAFGNPMSELNIKTYHTLNGRQWKVYRDFLTELIKGMCEGSILYFDKYHHIDPWHPLTFNERCMYTLLSTSAAKISPVIMSEVPLNRHKMKTSGYAKDGQPGRLDLWIHLNDNCDVVLELKRVSVGIKKINEKKPSKKFQSSWGRPAGVVAQAEALTKQTKDWSDKIIRVGLLVVYGYASSKNAQKMPSDNECEDYRKNLICHIQKLHPEPDWCTYWIPRQDMRKLDDQINPVIAIIAYIDKKT